MQTKFFDDEQLSAFPEHSLSEQLTAMQLISVASCLGRYGFQLSIEYSVFSNNEQQLLKIKCHSNFQFINSRLGLNQWNKNKYKCNAIEY